MSIVVKDFKDKSGKWVTGYNLEGVSYRTEASKLWYNMVQRCKVGGKIQENSPRYVGCTMSDNFKDFQFFADWCHKQKGYGNLDDKGHRWELEKDLLCKGNKLYGEDYCVFLPHIINSTIVKSNKIRGEFPIGVCYAKKERKYFSYIKIEGTLVGLGRYPTPLEAFIKYKAAKEKYLQDMADRFKNEIDERAYQALLNYQISEDD